MAGNWSGAADDGGPPVQLVHNLPPSSSKTQISFVHLVQARLLQNYPKMLEKGAPEALLGSI